MGGIANNSTLINKSYDRVHRMISVKFDVNLSQEQMIRLIEVQPEKLRKALQADKADLKTLEILVETISEKITGVCYPTEKSTPYFKEYFKRKLQDNKLSYFIE